MDTQELKDFLKNNLSLTAVLKEDGMHIQLSFMGDGHPFEECVFKFPHVPEPKLGQPPYIAYSVSNDSLPKWNIDLTKLTTQQKINLS